VAGNVLYLVRYSPYSQESQMAESSPDTGKDWRELCAAAVEEPDSERLASLVNQIIEAIDQHHYTSQMTKRVPWRSKP
jgi:hypothetical protein